MSEIIYIKQNVETFGGRSATKLKARIAVIDDIIDTLQEQVLTAITAGGVVNYEEYEINTGQTKNKVIYRDTAAVFRAIKGYETLRQFYVNKLTPRRIRLVDGKNFN